MAKVDDGFQLKESAALVHEQLHKLGMMIFAVNTGGDNGLLRRHVGLTEALQFHVLLGAQDRFHLFGHQVKEVAIVLSKASEH